MSWDAAPPASCCDACSSTTRRSMRAGSTWRRSRSASSAANAWIAAWPTGKPCAARSTSGSSPATPQSRPLSGSSLDRMPIGSSGVTTFRYLRVDVLGPPGQFTAVNSRSCFESALGRGTLCVLCVVCDSRAIQDGMKYVTPTNRGCQQCRAAVHPHESLRPAPESLHREYAAVLDRLADVCGLHVAVAGQVGDAARDAQHAVKAARRPAQAGSGTLQKACVRGSE